jgi:nitrate/nitrite transporter NarK
MALLVLICIQIAVVGLFQPPLILAAVTIEGFCSAGILPLMMQALMETPAIGPERMGTAAGLYFSVGEIGGFGGPLIMGTVTDATGGSFLAAMLAFAVLMLVMLIPALRLPVTRSAHA